MSNDKLKQRITEMLTSIDGVDAFLYDERDEDPRFDWNRVGKEYVKTSLYPEWDTIEADPIDHHGGEGQGDQYWTVWKFTEGGESVLVKFSGWYASYSGAEYEDWQFVEPKQKVVTVYE